MSLLNATHDTTPTPTHTCSPFPSFSSSSSNYCILILLMSKLSSNFVFNTGRWRLFFFSDTLSNILVFYLFFSHLSRTHKQNYVMIIMIFLCVSLYPASYSYKNWWIRKSLVKIFFFKVLLVYTSIFEGFFNASFKKSIYIYCTYKFNKCSMKFQIIAVSVYMPSPWFPMKKTSELKHWKRFFPFNYSFPLGYRKWRLNKILLLMWIY